MNDTLVCPGCRQPSISMERTSMGGYHAYCSCQVYCNLRSETFERDSRPSNDERGLRGGGTVTAGYVTFRHPRGWEFDLRGWEFDAWAKGGDPWTGKAAPEVWRYREAKLINATPHALIILREGDDPIHLPPSGLVLRVATTRGPADPINLEDGTQVPCTSVYYGEVEGFAYPEEGQIVIVSSMVLDALKSRGQASKFAAPGELVRDEFGVVVGCRGLTR